MASEDDETASSFEVKAGDILAAFRQTRKNFSQELFRK
jgi:hypothetical protein